MMNQKKYRLKGNVYYFSLDYDGIDKSKILDVPNYLVVKNNIK